MRRAVLGLLLTLPGCASDFIEPWEVSEPRLLGARVEVESAPERPRPRLGEPFSIRQYIGLPGPIATPLSERYSMDVAICLGLKTATGELGCIGEQELEPRVQTVSETEILLSGLNLDLAALASSFGITPEQLAEVDGDAVSEFAELDRLALFGVLCVEGRAERVAGKSIRTEPPSQLFRCLPNAGAAYPDAYTFTVSVLLDRGRPLDANRNPTFACDPAAPESACVRGVATNGEPLVPGTVVLALPAPAEPTQPRQVIPLPAREDTTSLPWEGCASDATLPQVRAGSGEHELRVRFDPSDRETYQAEGKKNGRITLTEGRESLLLTQAVTTKGGELASHFSELRATRPDSDAELAVAYTPPEVSDDPAEAIPQNGRLVRFYLTLRDQRGGVDFTTRELCLLPGE